ncbi:MAG: 30S ribosomal protein S12 methylthiotransferase RimO [Bacteroidota bacterium]|nr:30S ribosomal protein S12 methylthiotransferase RimO [Candidatus Kapabacteria bacterium]MDW8219145.1 30S ribosomal protein S12 methylthiotransferase RimO [Bacteroidota bacterium]
MHTTQTTASPQYHSSSSQPSRSINTVAVITLGCSKNTTDSEVLMGMIQAHGMSFAPAREADAVIINTCGFIDRAKEESIETIFEAIRQKEELATEGKSQTLIVAGCLSQRYGDELRKEMPQVDHFFGESAFEHIVKALTPNFKYSLLGERVLTTAPHYAYLKISEGCDNPCSFCAIPLIRGRHRSRPPEQLVEEAQFLVARGVKEIILIAQDSTDYGRDLTGKRTLADLLQRLSDIDGIQWLRLMYAFPSKFPQDILPVIAERPNICKYLDIPLQHASTRVLKSMRRGITRSTTERLLQHIRDTVPGIALRTTFIVGYPSETEADFQELCDFVREQQFDRVGVFEYSQEDDTYAYILGDPIPADVKRERAAELMAIQRTISLEKNEAKIGSCLSVLIDQVLSNDDGTTEYQGRSEADAPEVDNEVFLTSSLPLRVGEFVQAKIYDAAEYDLFGEVQLL